MNIADRIDVAMRIAGYNNQAEFARITGIPTSTLSRVLSGKSLPNPDNLAAIALACKRSIDWIVTGTDNPQSTVLEVALVYLSPDELKMVTQFREATESGRQFIQMACTSADKRSSTSTATTDDQPEP